MMNKSVIDTGTVSRRILLALTCAAALAAPLMAQDPGATPPPPPQQQQQGAPGEWQGRGGDRQVQELEHLTRALNLSPEQVSQIKTIQTGARQQMMALREDTTTAQADKRAKGMSIHQTAQANIRAVLNDDQKSKFDAMQAKMRERREQRQQADQPPAPPAAF